ncbi:MAG: DUF1566 domain-containing protein [Desulfobacteraceae bacterium]|jgi:hypothetical protein|nr:DUF1566 domain-containing protein [Desulfobacteraceae bacterium]
MKKFIIAIILLGICSTNVLGQYYESQESIGNDTIASGYTVVDTGQAKCYDASGAEIACPAGGKPFYGQDAQHDGHLSSYTDNGDGTVTDNITGLMWQQSPDTNEDGDIKADDKLTYDDAVARVNTFGLCGYNDWRLPTIKELYSLVDFSGAGPIGYESTKAFGMSPFINNAFFDFSYGDISAGEQIFDTPYASSTLYAANIETECDRTLFGVNFSDGSIKGHGLSLFGPDKTFFVIYVRGNPDYGQNDFADNGDGTITDNATGLMWSQDDSVSELNWEETLTWVQQKNEENYLGYNDWRLPNIKELQSIVDYSRAPDSSRSPAISPLFYTTLIVNEAGRIDYPCYWSSTTQADWSDVPGVNAAYVAFGRAMGCMNDIWLNVHGAGAIRSDPKKGDPDNFPSGVGPQGDAIRIYNYYRLVHDAV